MVPVARIRHAKRNENALAGEVGEGFSGHSLDNHGKQEVPGVRVLVLGARGEVEMPLGDDAGERLRIGGRLLERVPREHEKPCVVSQPARMVHQIVDRDRRAVVGHLGDVFPDVIAIRELVLRHEQRDARGGELLGRGADVEERSGGDRHVALEVRPTVAPRVGEDAIAHDAERAAWHVSLVVLLEHRIDAVTRRSAQKRCAALGDRTGGEQQHERDRAGGVK